MRGSNNQVCLLMFGFSARTKPKCAAEDCFDCWWKWGCYMILTLSIMKKAGKQTEMCISYENVKDHSLGKRHPVILPF
jgi:hypothetical protein